MYLGVVGAGDGGGGVDGVDAVGDVLVLFEGPGVKVTDFEFPYFSVSRVERLIDGGGGGGGIDCSGSSCRC